jgi:hypothetical protein
VTFAIVVESTQALRSTKPHSRPSQSLGLKEWLCYPNLSLLKPLDDLAEAQLFRRTFWCVRQLENQFARAREAHFFAGNAFDGFWIRLEGVDLFGERLIFVVHFADLRADIVDFLLRAAHGDKPVRPEDVVNEQREKGET